MGKIESRTSLRRTKRRHDNPGPVFHLRQGDWKQVGHIPRFVAGGLRREGRAGRAGVEEILLSTHAHVSRGSDRETFELQHARTTRIERFDLRLLLVWRKKERALVLVLVLVLLPLPRGCARACVY